MLHEVYIQKQISCYCLINPLFLRTDRYVNINCYQLKIFHLDITPNSYDYPTKKSVVLIVRMNFSILEMQGLINMGY